jgi:malate synthase
MGGMAAQIPIRNNPEANEAAMERVRQDKLREVRAGHDGTWVAHPGLVPVAREIFDEYMKTPNQIQPPKEARSRITAANLLEVPHGAITEKGLRRNIDVALQYLQSWLGGLGCVPIYDLMEDAATAEICRAQTWQWLRYGAHFDDGRPITTDLFERLLNEVVADVSRRTTGSGATPANLQKASDLLRQMSEGEFEEFLTSVAYEYLP